jgi:hypothetical protein
MVIKLTVVIIVGYHCYQFHTKFYPISFSQSLSPYIDKLLWIISVDLNVTDQLLIRSFAFIRYWRKKWEYNETVHQLFVYFKKAYDLVRREALYSILIEFA